MFDSLTLKPKITAALATMLLLFTHSVLANKNIAIGPKLGDIAPAISAINSQKERVALKQLSADKGLVLVFFRSADWCPYCKKHLLELDNVQEKFSSLGYGLAGISYDTTEVLNQFASQHALKFPLLADQQAQTMLAFGILNKAYSKGDDNYGIPYPGVVVINAQGKVIDSYFYQGYKNRIDFNELYKKLNKTG
jgi:peroxiredoxin